MNSKPNWSYLAGLMDGEGHISLLKNRKHLKSDGFALTLNIGITNTNLPLMKWLVSNFGGVYYTRYSSDNSNPRWSDRYDWFPKGRKNKEELLLGVLPYLIIKREQAEIALEFLRLDYSKNPEQRQVFVQRLNDLNRRGKSPTTNTSNISSDAVKIESELTGDRESAPDVNQGFDWVALQQLRKI